MGVMTERPIIFSGPMVRAILDGRKHQTRRVVTGPWRDKPLPEFRGGIGGINNPEEWGWENGETGRHIGFVDDPINEATLPCPYGWPGDRLWVRETFYSTHKTPCSENRIYYRANCDALAEEMLSVSWTPSIHMPKWAARIWLEVTGVRVERLQDISCADAIAEGIRPAANSMTIDCDTPDPRQGFKHLWDSLNAKRAPWASNPWVWIIEFRRVND